MASLRVSLVQCPVWGLDDPPLGLAQMAGCATHGNHEASVFDLNVRLWREAADELKPCWSWEALPRWSDPAWVGRFLERTGGLWDRYAEEVLACDPHAVAFSAALGSHLTALELARRVKRRSPKTTVIFGGPFASAPQRAEAVLTDPAVDVVVMGVGEDLFPKMLGLFKAGGRWVPLPGMLVKGPDGVVRGGRSVPYTFDLDIAPMPDYSSFTWTDYARPEQLPFSASRGCAERCAFCAARGFWGRYSFQSGDRIYGDLARLRERNPGARRIEFYDIMANGDIPSLLRLAERLRDDPAHPALAWRMNAAPRPEMDASALRTLKAGGCEEIVFGVESGSDRVLERMGRPWSAAAMEAVLRDTHEAGIRCVASLIAGFPGETEEALSETRVFLRRSRPWLDGVCVAPAALEEPSLLYGRPERFGLEVRPADGWAPFGLERARLLLAEAAGLGIAVRRPFTLSTPDGAGAVLVAGMQ